MANTCSTCTFWASYSEEKGQCLMASGIAPEPRVTVVPMISEPGETHVRPILTDDPRFEGIRFYAQMITPNDFFCESWQER